MVMLNVENRKIEAVYRLDFFVLSTISSQKKGIKATLSTTHSFRPNKPNLIKEKIWHDLIKCFSENRKSKIEAKYLVGFPGVSTLPYEKNGNLAILSKTHRLRVFKLEAKYLVGVPDIFYNTISKTLEQNNTFNNPQSLGSFSGRMDHKSYLERNIVFEGLLNEFIGLSSKEADETLFNLKPNTCWYIPVKCSLKMELEIARCSQMELFH
ncbi:hypothetical protein CEXT_613331 [Caerostris extrusa]|uniref:Uncharacterized protein n=1 Tax=Caerostris extrusa TaxID=172846 RepID=A0AAV4P5B7_CAEEX|nr:hypothetical protein CEXT_613331 [Caerostris extrusa]